MTITQLSDDTSRVLKSTLVLNNATTVIKELLENALDSRATSITIEISANTLDMIQVKDNGVGIGIEDRQLLCKRGCTSKIRTLEDLNQLGGSSLGFRGEALASIAELSESVTITTCIEGEAVGTAMKFGPGGKLISSVSASHAPGTTVRVQNFLIKIPVRKQAALKSVNKTPGEIKRMLQSYAFARPLVRLGFKLLKGKNEKANWSFAPCDTADDLSIVARKVVGNEVVSQCTQQSATLTSTNENSSGEDGYQLRALFLVRAADVSKTSGAGQFITIDNRPVSADRGAMREIVKLYRRYLQHSITDGQKMPAKPFLVFCLSCPQSSYDVNIEPAKDDVLFNAPARVVEIAEQAFTKQYGELQSTTEVSKRPKESKSSERAEPGFDLLLARKRDASESFNSAGQDVSGSSVLDDRNSRRSNPAEAPKHTDSRQQQPFRNMYDVHSDDDDHVGSHTDQELVTSVDEDDGLTEAAGENKNPFTIAALHRRLSPRKMDTREESTMSEISTNAALLGNNTTASLRLSPPRLMQPKSLQYLPTPSKSPCSTEPYQNPGPPLPRWPKSNATTDQDSEIEEDMAARFGNQSDQRLLHQWIESLGAGEGQQDTTEGRSSGGGSRAAVESKEQSVSPTKDLTTPRVTLNQPSPFRSSSRSPIRNSSSLFLRPSSTNVRDREHSPRRPSASELDQIMEFEHRKKAVNRLRGSNQVQFNPAELARLQQDSMGSSLEPQPRLHSMPILAKSQTSSDQPSVPSRGIIPTNSTVLSPSNPHRNRYEAAIRSLGAVQNLVTSSEPTGAQAAAAAAIGDTSERNHTDIRRKPILSPSDPRSYLINQLDKFQPKSKGSEKSLQIKRTKSARLPFETIPKEALKHNLCYIPLNPFPARQNLQQQTKRLVLVDGYVRTGQIEPVIRRSPSPSLLLQQTPSPKTMQTVISEWQTTLETLVENTFTNRPPPSSSPSEANQLAPEKRIAESDPYSTGSTQIRNEQSTTALGFRIDLAQAIQVHLNTLSTQASDTMAETNDENLSHCTELEHDQTL